MFRKNYLIFLGLLLSTGAPLVSFGQASVSLPTFSVCQETNISIPVSYQNLSRVDTFQIVFSYNPSALTYLGYTYLHPNLLGLRFNIDQETGSVRLTFRKGAALDFHSGRLIEMTFKVQKQPTSLTWNLARSSFWLDGGSISASFINGGITLFPRTRIVLSQLPAEVCPGSFEASVRATISGGTPPYSYQWIGSPLQVLSDSIARNLGTGVQYRLRITDANSCIADTVFFVKTRKLNTVEIKATPDTVFLSNPQVIFEAENKSTPFITRYRWNFGDGDSLVTSSVKTYHVYDKVKEFAEKGGQKYDVTLTITNEFGCDTTIKHSIPIREAKIFIPNVFTPNGDGANDYFKITLDDKKDKVITTEYVKLELLIFNRWGRKVFLSSDYRHDWDGGTLSDGVYFYSLNAMGLFKTDTYKGAVHLIR